MAIQLPNPGTGNGQTGDNEYVLWQKTRSNFQDGENAASRIVGTETGNLLEVGAFGLGTESKLTDSNVHVETVPSGFYGNTSLSQTPEGLPQDYGRWVYIKTSHAHAGFILAFAGSGDVYFKGQGFDKSWGVYRHFLDSSNTAVDANGFIKAASPIVQLHDDKIVCNELSKKQNIEFVKHATGDYELIGTTGFADDGWYIEIPTDTNQNPLFAIEKTEKDGNIRIRCFERKWDAKSCKVVANKSKPLDINEGRWIDIRLNELAEDLDEV